MPDFITNCAPEPYDQYPGVMNDIYPQADFCVFNATNFNHLLLSNWTIKIGGIEHNDNPPWCGEPGVCNNWEMESPGENCTPHIEHHHCTQGYFIGGYCDANGNEILDPYMWPEGDYGACDMDGDGVAETNNQACYPNACQIALDCVHSNDCRCMEQNGTCDAVALLYQGTVVAIQYVNTIAVGNDPVHGISTSIAMYDPWFTDIFDYVGYPRGGDYIDDIIFYRASTGTHHSLTLESYEYIFNQAEFMDLNLQFFNGLANVPEGLVAPPGFSLIIGNNLTLEFEEEDTQQTTDIIYELHIGANLISVPLATESWNSTLNNESPIPSAIDGIITEGTATIQTSPGNWIGSLTEIESYRGYWFVADSNISFILSGIMMDSNYLYQLHPGNNLVSFPNEVSMPVQNTFSDAVSPYIDGVLTEGTATIQISPGNWVGSLTEFVPFKGYWIITNNNVNFTFGNIATSGLSNRIKRTFNEKNITIPPLDENGNYQNPHTGIYDWYIPDVIEYVKLQLTGTITKDTVLNTNKKKVEKVAKTKKPNKSIRRSFGK